MQLECKQCGNCCPKDCSSFEIHEFDSSRASCTTHPNEDRMGCTLGPEYWFKGRIACRAAIDYLLSIDSTLKFDIEIGDNSRVVYRRNDIYLQARELWSGGGLSFFDLFVQCLQRRKDERIAV